MIAAIAVMGMSADAYAIQASWRRSTPVATRSRHRRPAAAASRNSAPSVLAPMATYASHSAPGIPSGLP